MENIVKVVLFCGGLGLRMRDYDNITPKPMVKIGYRPILWHLMKYYAYYGHKDFILCLGYRADLFKKYFLEYDECVSNDFILYGGGKKLELLNEDIKDWKITFVDTGLHSNIGSRLVAVKDYLQGEEIFLANYSDGLTNMNLSNQISEFLKQEKIASFLSVQPNLSYHTVKMDKNKLVTEIQPFMAQDIRINGGFFILKNAIFNYIKKGEELVQEPFSRLIKEKQLISYSHAGFWASLDTFKDKQVLDELYEIGHAPWEVWKE